MFNSSFCESERKKIEKMNKFQLSQKFKTIGCYIVIATFSSMLIRKIADVDIFWLKELLRSLLLLGMLIISISKDKVEDEFIESLRAQSYRLAFVLTVIYALIQPYVEYVVDFLLNDNPKDFGSFSYFQVLTFMLVIQIAFFEQLKRMNK